MFVHPDIPGNRWNVVEAEDKKAARLNMIKHLLDSVPYEHVELPEFVFPERPAGNGYRRTDRSLLNEVPNYAATLLAGGKIPPPYVDPED